MTIFNARTRTQFGSWNVRTMCTTSSLLQVTKEMSAYNLEILGLSDTRWNGSGEFRTNDSHLYSVKPLGENLEYVVGILLTKSAARCLLFWQPISGRIFTARFKSHIRNISLIQCYAPTEVSSLEG